MPGLNDRQQAAFDGWFGQKGYRYGCLMRVLQVRRRLFHPAEGGILLGRRLGCSFFNYPRENMTLLVMQQQLNGGDVVTGVKKALVRRMEGRERGQEG